MRVSLLFPPPFPSSHFCTNPTCSGEGHFDDNKGSGTATPTAAGGDDGRAGKRKKMGGKKAKTTKQRLAIADGEIDI
jgi:hypothetical protein